MHIGVQQSSASYDMLSHSGTIKLLDRLAEGYDMKVEQWSDSLLPCLQVQCLDNLSTIHVHAL